jgi:translation elongation factor EF-Ts
MRDPARTVAELIGDNVAKMGEKIEVRRFVRFQLGENQDGRVSS